jgi:hypothetical protein
VIPQILGVVTDQWRTVFGILSFIALGQGLASTVLKSLYRDQLTSVEYFSLGLAGWILPISLISLLWLVLGLSSNMTLNRLVIPAGILLLLLMLFRLTLRADSGPDSAKTIFFLLTFVLVFVLLRLVFVSRVVMPSYFDSAQHYSIIKDILQSGRAWPPASTPYYHSGYHILTAFLATALNADIAKTMLVLGQMVLGVMPVSLFFLVKHTTGSKGAGIFAVILAALGWYMPAHAANWGKYPALTSLALLPFVLSLVYLLLQYRFALPPQKRWIHYTILGLSILILTLLHSRSPIILAVIFVAWMIAAWQGRLSLPIRALMFVAVLIPLVLQLLFVQKQGVLLPLLDPYLHKGIWITAFVLLLSIFAIREYPQVVFACLLSVCMLLGCLFVPIQIPGYGALTLLDRPLVEMILYLPLAFLGGLGLAGLEKLWSHLSLPLWGLIGKYVYGLLIALMVIHAFTKYDFYPADCCVLVGKDDLAALDWMKDHLPGDAQIGISVTELNVLQSDRLEGYTGGDAGIWITPLIDRATFPLLYNSEFGQESIRNMLCQSRVSHLYVGERGQPFDPARLQEHPEWYKVLLSREKTTVYEVIGCR